jgi:sugar phosphate isomerase/epimerase
MHLAFMTFSAPTWTISELLAGAIRFGYDGIEPRTVCGHKHGIELTMTKQQRADARAAFADCGIKMSAVATSLTYACPDPAVIDGRVEETKRYLQLAADLGGAPRGDGYGGRGGGGRGSAGALRADRR